MHFRCDVAHGADMGQGVQRHGDVEMILQLADEFQYLQRVEAEVGQELAGGSRVDRTPADALEDFDDVAFDAFG